MPLGDSAKHRHIGLQELLTAGFRLLAAGLGDLVDAPLPVDYMTGIAPRSYDLRLRPGVPAVDADDAEAVDDADEATPSAVQDDISDGEAESASDAIDAASQQTPSIKSPSLQRA